MGTDFYIAKEERSSELIDILESDRDPKMISDPKSDSFYLIGHRAATKPLRTFTVMVKESVLEKLSDEVKLYALGESGGINTVGDLRNYLKLPGIEVNFASW